MGVAVRILGQLDETEYALVKVQETTAFESVQKSTLLRRLTLFVLMSDLNNEGYAQVYHFTGDDIQHHRLT